MNIEVGDKVRVKWGFRKIREKHIGVGSIPDYLQNRVGTVRYKNERCVNITFGDGKEIKQDDDWSWDYNWIEKVQTEDDEFRKLLIKS